MRMTANEPTPTAMATEIEKTIRTALSNVLDITGLTTLLQTENERHARKPAKQIKAGSGSQRAGIAIIQNLRRRGRRATLLGAGLRPWWSPSIASECSLDKQAMSPAHAAGTGQTSTRTDALVSQPETGKMAASIIPVAAGCHPLRASDQRGRLRQVPRIPVSCSRSRTRLAVGPALP